MAVKTLIVSKVGVKNGAAWARSKSLPVIEMPADWKNYGRSAGMVRNQAMLERAEGLLAIGDGHSPGTKNMIRIAERRGIRCFVFVITS